MVKNYSFALIILMLSTNLLAKESNDVDIFSYTRGVNKAEGLDKEAKIPSYATKKMNFSYQLVGISKLGTKYTIFLKNTKKKKTIKFIWNKINNNKKIDDKFSIAEVNQRKIKVKYYDGLKCITNARIGIECLDKNEFQLNLVNKVVKGKVKVTLSLKSKKKKDKSKKINNNPFLNLMTKAKSPAINRIQKEKVPENMRLVKTPFGDHLVPR